MPKNEEKCGCETSGQEKVLTIKWTRLVSEDETCPRCSTTEQELKEAVDVLNQSLTTMGIKAVLEKKSLSVAEFEKDPLQSNRIWINNQPLEDYIDGKVGQSPCCDVCGSAECRILEVEAQTFEAVPSKIIIRAGLIAAAQMITPEEKKPCCGDEQ